MVQINTDTFVKHWNSVFHLTWRNKRWLHHQEALGGGDRGKMGGGGSQGGHCWNQNSNLQPPDPASSLSAIQPPYLVWATGGDNHLEKSKIQHVAANLVKRLCADNFDPVPLLWDHSLAEFVSCEDSDSIAIGATATVSRTHEWGWHQQHLKGKDS